MHSVFFQQDKFKIWKLNHALSLSIKSHYLLICCSQVLFSDWINFKMQMAPLNSQKLLMFLLFSYSLSCSLLVCSQSVVWSSSVLLMMFWTWSGEINFCSQQWHLSRYLWFILLTLVLQQLLYQNLWGLYLDLIWI